MAWYSIKAQSDERAEIYLYGTIGCEVGAAQFIAELNALKASQIVLHINSNGGDVFDGFAIYNALKMHRARIVARIEGLAASMASLIALAADECLIASNGFVMIHNPWVCISGDAAELQTAADLADSLKKQMAGVYAARMKITTEEANAIMDAETWLSAQEAVDRGFADGVFEPVKAAARLDLSRFGNAPLVAAQSFGLLASDNHAEETHKMKGNTMDEKLKGKLSALGVRAELSEEAINSLIAKIDELKAELDKAKESLAKKEEEAQQAQEELKEQQTEQQQETERVEGVLALAAKYSLFAEAVEAVKAKTSVAAFTAKALDVVAARKDGNQRIAFGLENGVVGGLATETLASLREKIKGMEDSPERRELLKQIRAIRDNRK